MKEVHVVAYIRVSSKKQKDEGNSLDGQRRILEKLAKQKGYIIDEWFEDGARSASHLKRPAFQKMIKKVSSGKINYIILHKRDRLLRSVANIEEVFQSLL